MSKQNKNQSISERLEITGIATKGKSVARDSGGRVVFISNAVPGDVITAQIQKKRRSYYEGRAIDFHHLSEKRTTPKCSHFGTCGGCKWQNMQYQHQLEYKSLEVEECLNRIAKVDLPQIEPIIGSEHIYHYRNKMDFSFSNRRWLFPEEIIDKEKIPKKNALGFHISGRWDKVLDINQCYLHTDASEEIRFAIKDFANKNKLTFYDDKERKGLLRNLIIRVTSTGQIMVLVQFFEDDESDRVLLLDFLKSKFPSINSLQYTINQKYNDTIYDLSVHCYYGKPYIVEQMDQLYFRIGPKSFYQTNSQQAHQLYQKILEFANFSKDDLVYDLYTGTGTIAQFIAHSVNNVIAIEAVPEAIENAKINAQHNSISNISFFVGDVKKVLSQDFIQSNGMPNIVITDPPREGMHKKIIQTILTKASPNKIIYISCNVATQSRDIALLDELYKVTKVQPLDMFPQTHHVENIVVLEKRSAL